MQPIERPNSHHPASFQPNGENVGERRKIFAVQRDFRRWAETSPQKQDLRRGFEYIINMNVFDGLMQRNGAKTMVSARGRFLARPLVSLELRKVPMQLCEKSKMARSHGHGVVVQIETDITERAKNSRKRVV